MGHHGTAGRIGVAFAVTGLAVWLEPVSQNLGPRADRRPAHAAGRGRSGAARPGPLERDRRRCRDGLQARPRDLRGVPGPDPSFPRGGGRVRGLRRDDPDRLARRPGGVHGVLAARPVPRLDARLGRQRPRLRREPVVARARPAQLRGDDRRGGVLGGLGTGGRRSPGSRSRCWPTAAARRPPPWSQWRSLHCSCRRCPGRTTGCGSWCCCRCSWTSRCGWTGGRRSSSPGWRRLWTMVLLMWPLQARPGGGPGPQRRHLGRLPSRPARAVVRRARLRAGRARHDAARGLVAEKRPRPRKRRPPPPRPGPATPSSRPADRLPVRHGSHPGPLDTGL